jgi:hypothetical protein
MEREATMEPRRAAAVGADRLTMEHMTAGPAREQASVRGGAERSRHPQLRPAPRRPMPPHAAPDFLTLSQLLRPGLSRIARLAGGNGASPGGWTARRAPCDSHAEISQGPNG